METLGNIIGPLGLLALLVGVVMFLPFSFFKTRRKVAGMLAVGGLVAFIVGVALSPTPAPTTKGPAAVASVPPPDAAVAKATAGEAKRVLETETKTLWASLLQAIEPCDRAAEQVAKTTKTGNIYEVYPAAKAGTEACGEASRAVEALSPPNSATGEVAAAFEKGLDACENGQQARTVAFSKLAEVADGDMRPSAVTEVKEYMQAAGAAGLVCAAGMLEAATKGGVDTKFFEKS